MRISTGVSAQAAVLHDAVVAGKKAERDKITEHETANMMAVLNNMEMQGISIEKEKLQIGPRWDRIMIRLCAMCIGEEFDSNSEHEYGFKERMWSAPNMYQYWKRRWLVKLINNSRSIHMVIACTRIEHMIN